MLLFENLNNKKKQHATWCIIELTANSEQKNPNKNRETQIDVSTRFTI